MDTAAEASLSKYHTSTRRNSQIHTTWKSKMTAAAILNFGKMSITPDWIELIAPNFMRRWITAMRDDTWPSPNRKLIRVTSSNERLEHRCDRAMISRHTGDLNLQIFLLSLRRIHLFALLSKLLICHSYLSYLESSLIVSSRQLCLPIGVLSATSATTGRALVVGWRRQNNRPSVRFVPPGLL